MLLFYLLFFVVGVNRIGSMSLVLSLFVRRAIPVSVVEPAFRERTTISSATVWKVTLGNCARETMVSEREGERERQREAERERERDREGGERGREAGMERERGRQRDRGRAINTYKHIVNVHLMNNSWFSQLGVIVLQYPLTENPWEIFHDMGTIV